MRAALVFLLASFALAGCPDTRPTCEVYCDNEIRCGFYTDRTSCMNTCTRSIAMDSADCRTQLDRYHRCWAGAGTCPSDDTVAAPGCSAEFADRALACTGASPLLSTHGI